MTNTLVENVTATAPSSLRTAMNWINGEWMNSANRTKSFDPATSQEIGTYADVSQADAEAAIQAAVQAFASTDWKDNRKLRAKVLNQIADRFEARREDLIEILSLENGKVKPEAAFEIDMIPSKFRYWAATVLTNYGRAMEVEPGHLSFVTRSAIGVVGVIAPFNSPLVLTVRSLAPALAAGTTTVIKLPGSTAQTNFLFSQVLSEVVDLPKGVINVFSESGSGGSALLVESKDVRVISFTGSTKTAKTISAAGAPTLKLFQTELGGKTPMIIFDDADLEAAPKVEKALTTFAGQFCMTGSRLLVQRGVADPFRTMITERLQRVKAGPASDPSSDMGPLIDKPNVERVNKMVEDAIAAGAKVLLRNDWAVVWDEFEEGGFKESGNGRQWMSSWSISTLPSTREPLRKTKRRRGESNGWENCARRTLFDGAEQSILGCQGRGESKR